MASDSSDPVGKPLAPGQGACEHAPAFRLFSIFQAIRSMAGEQAPWTYEPDETPKRKHHWARNEAGFVKVGNIRIGKCPANLTIEDAERLLNVGVPWSPRGWTKNFPERIYCVHDGWVFRATVTRPGSSYHGFPELREKLPPDRRLHEELLRKARTLGVESERRVKQWLQS
jgi:hypothetical protein